MSLGKTDNSSGRELHTYGQHSFLKTCKLLEIKKFIKQLPVIFLLDGLQS